MQKQFLFGALWSCVVAGISSAQATHRVDFARDVQPILKTQCYDCHGPSQQSRAFRLDRRSVAMPNRVGANRANIIPGNSAASPLFLKLIGKAPGAQMPPTGALSSEQIELIRAWIDEGAEWPNELSGEAPPSVPDTQATRIMEAVRANNDRAFREQLRRFPKALNRKGHGGFTPLMYASLYGSTSSVQVLLELGADPNAKNDANATALHYALDSPEKVRLLLEKGADPNARSDEDQVPLVIAIGIRPASTAVIRTLLDHGAKASQADSLGRTPLMAAAVRGDIDALKVLLDRGAGTRPLPISQAARADCIACVQALISFADLNDLSAALTDAVRARSVPLIKMLLAKGAKVRPDAIAAAALSDEKIPGETLKDLVSQAESVNAPTPLGAVLDLATRQGNTPLVALLRNAGAKASGTTGSAAAIPKPASSVRAAIERSLPLLQHADGTFLQKSGCVSCHNNSLVARAVAAARREGISVDEHIVDSQRRQIVTYLAVNREKALQGNGPTGAYDAVGYILWGLEEIYKPDSTTSDWARYLKNTQRSEGWWRPIGNSRPPHESSAIQVTAVAMRALQLYMPISQRPEYEKSVRLATRWLEGSQPISNEDRVFLLLGLKWANGSGAVIQRVARDLIAAQNPDGGWAQLSTLSSDAYATGQALTALRESGLVRVTDPVYQKGVRFLLNTQLDDGSWFVQTRTLPAQPYFDSEFPHGRDQFISAAATSWAVMALVPTSRKE